MTATKSDGAITTFVTSYVNWAGSFICYPASKLSGGGGFGGGARKESTPPPEHLRELACSHWRYLSVQYVVLGPRKSAMPLVRTFSENDKIFRREKKYVE